jgi:hypothetical protein
MRKSIAFRRELPLTKLRFLIEHLKSGEGNKIFAARDKMRHYSLNIWHQNNFIRCKLAEVIKVFASL